MKIYLKKLRKELNLSQNKFSAKADISLRYYQRIEAGECTPSLHILNKIAKANNLSIHDLIDD